MARLYSCGFELGSNQNNFDFHTSNGVIVVDTTQPRSGTYALHITSLISGTSQRTSYRMVNAATGGPFWGRGFLRIGTLPATTTTIMRFAGAGNTLLVKLTPTGALQLHDEVGLIGTAAGTLSLAQYYRLELFINGTLGAGAHQATLRVDGSDVVTATNRTFTNPTVQQLDIGANLLNDLNATGEWWWDDIAINDSTAGGDQTSWPGDGHIIHLRPSGNGDANSGVTRGGADSGSDFGQIDEVTPNDATDYLILTGASAVAWANVQDASGLGLGGAYIIKLVSVGGRVALASAATGNWFPSVKSQSGGTALDGAPITLAVTTWFAHNDTSGLQQYGVTAYADPQSGGVWTVAKLDTMQIGAKTTDGNPATFVTALWALIEYQVFNVNIPSVLPGGVYGGLWLPHGGLA